MNFGKATVVLILFAVFFTSCKKNEEPPAVQPPQFEIQKRDNMPVFDSLNVYEYVKRQTEFGPRVSGLPSWENAKKYLIESLQKSGAKVTLQDFEAVVPWGEKMKFTNIIGSFNPDAAKRVLLCAHWDSRPHADKEADSSKHKTPIPGANDGASGTGVLLELANVIGKNKLDYGVDIVLFDGEDYGVSSSLEGYCLGSKHFASNFPLPIKPKFGILLDLVGDIEAVYMREPASMQYAGDLVELLWRYAQSSGNSRFKDFISQPIYDDHIPLNEAGIKTLNIIDAGLVGANSANPRRNYWHTLNDDMRNISKTTLYDLGRVLTGFLYSLKIN
ncbi:MAG: M28 family peptidase [Bacteroidetes bacterium]|nr:M28 family peptidase [Bacteroidota bacterium]